MRSLILDPKIDKAVRGAQRFMTSHNLVDRFRLENPGSEMWTWKVWFALCPRQVLPGQC